MKTTNIVAMAFIGMLTIFSATAQNNVGIGTTTPDPSAVLDASSTTQGFLPPRMTNAEIKDISSPATGLMVFSTDENKPFYYNGTIWIGFDGTSTLPIAIGDFHAGGIVFYVDGLGGGLVCAISDQSSGIHFNPGLNGSLVTSLLIGSGSANTDAIIAHIGSLNATYAAGLARLYTGGSYNDWFLPSQDELNEMYLNRVVINAAAIANGGSSFQYSPYWSSSVINYLYVYYQHLSTGGQGAKSIHTVDANVRAVRAF